MKDVTLHLPQLAFIAATRGALGVGIGLLVAGTMSPGRRKMLGKTLVAVGAATTVPAALLIKRRIKPSEGAA